MTKFKNRIPLLIFLIFLSFSASAKNPTYNQAEKLYKEGQYKAAADLLAPGVTSGQISDAKILVLYGNCLDQMTEEINTDAEMKCYRSAGAPKTPQCMVNFAERLNARYGSGSFKYDHNIVTIKYTGAHFDRAGAGAKSKDAAAEADYLRLSKQLIGHPSVVLPRIRAFLQKYPGGEWHRKGMLLYARVNEDIWWIHRNWAWLLYNWEISAEDLIVRAEPYRQEAIKAFKSISGGKEGRIAKKELKMIEKYKSDGKMYSIVNESNIKGVKVQPGRKQSQK